MKKLTLTQLSKEWDLIKKRTGKPPNKILLDSNEFSQFLYMLGIDYKQRKFLNRDRVKIIENGKGLIYRGVPVRRINN